MSTGVYWEWVHIRNTSLHHADILVQGFRSSGYAPVSRFAFGNQLMLYVPGKGVYFFYDRDLMREQLGVILEDLQKPGYAGKLRAKSRQMHEKVIETALKFQADLSVLSDKQLLKLFRDFRKAITAGPLITVQLYGIEACWSAKSPLVSFLKGKGSMPVFQNVLSVGGGKSIYFEEKENFLKVLSEIWKEKKLRKAFLEENYLLLQNFPKIRRHLKAHLTGFAWIRSEYVGKPFGFEDVLAKCTEELRKGSPQKMLRVIRANHVAALAEKKKLVSELDPLKEVKNVLDALDEFVSERDWAKGNFARAFLLYSQFLAEIEKRKGLPEGSSLFLLLDEVEGFLSGGKPVPLKTIHDRKKRFVFLTLDGKSGVFAGKAADKVLAAEGVGGFFRQKPSYFELKGIGAFSGKARGRARVLESARQIGEIKYGEIIVLNMTTVEFTPAFAKIAGIVTDEGGLSSHAAIVAREFKLPCVVGTRFATKTFRTGDLIEVDGENGIVKKL